MAAGSTYTKISSYTLGSNQTTVTFSSIPSTYTDLVLIAVPFSTQAGTSSNTLRANFNSDVSSNYSYTLMYGDGTSAVSQRGTNATFASFGSISQTSATAPYISIIHLMNYSNTTNYKSILVRDGRGDEYVEAWVNTWRSNSAINRIDLTRDGSNQIKSGSIFTLYGIAAA